MLGWLSFEEEVTVCGEAVCFVKAYDSADAAARIPITCPLLIGCREFI